MDSGAGFQLPLTPTARDSYAGYNPYTCVVTWVLYRMGNSFFSFYLASQFYVIPVNHCLLETLSASGFP